MVQCDGGRTAAQRQKQYDGEAHSFTSIRVMVVRSSTANPRKKPTRDGMSIFLRSFPGLTQADDVLDWILCTV
ncbi:hypothetical protein BDV30DRAFT_208105, partial [Aspergillus minisclerotigenes]